MGKRPEQNLTLWSCYKGLLFCWVVRDSNFEENYVKALITYCVITFLATLEMLKD